MFSSRGFFMAGGIFIVSSLVMMCLPGSTTEMYLELVMYKYKLALFFGGMGLATMDN